MAEYTVHFTQIVSISVTVEVDDTGEDFDVEQVIEQAFDEAPSGVCAQCSGWHQTWSRDDSGAELNSESVEKDGEEVYVEPEQWRRVRIEATQK